MICTLGPDHVRKKSIEVAEEDTIDRSAKPVEPKAQEV